MLLLYTPTRLDKQGLIIILLSEVKVCVCLYMYTYRHMFVDSTSVIITVGGSI